MLSKSRPFDNASMSDMLHQLVVEIHNTQAMILLVRTTLERSIQTISSKHVGHYRLAKAAPGRISR
jgi:hypothetical protein